MDLDYHQEMRCREFELLRAEILSQQHLENSWGLFAVTGTGTVLAFAIERADPFLCVVVPFVVLAAAYRVVGIRHDVWRISTYVMRRFDDADKTLGSAWERSLYRFRYWRRHIEKTPSRSAEAWMILFRLLLLGAMGASTLILGRSVATHGFGAFPDGSLDELAALIAILVLSAYVWFWRVKPRFSKELASSRQAEFLAGWDWALDTKNHTEADQPPPKKS